jgi:hypothetical protein
MMSMKVFYKCAVSCAMANRGSFAIILPTCTWKKLCCKFSLNNISFYSAVYKTNILNSGKRLNEVKCENFHNEWLTLYRKPSSHNGRC